ncbi:Riboflavin kinase [Fragilaria crotonensis]|nr:Riboflavin kinase [Fragilaria crotonensis]
MFLLSHLVHGFVPSLPKISLTNRLLVAHSQFASASITPGHDRAFTTRIALFSSSSSNTSKGTSNTTATATPSSRSVQPLDRVIRLRGKVATGYGRGGKKLGFPTANLPSSLFQNALQHVPTGVYVGWAWIEEDHQRNHDNDSPITATATGRGVAHKAAVNVGYSPTFEGVENKEKIVEAHLIRCSNDNNDDDAMTDFYGEYMRLLLVGYLRPEQKFDSFAALMQAITSDVETANLALDEEPYVSFRSDMPFFEDNDTKTKDLNHDPFAVGPVWIGKDGGDAEASWEFQDWNQAQVMSPV